MSLNGACLYDDTSWSLLRSIETFSSRRSYVMYYKDNLVAKHERTYRNHDIKININININHYLLTLQKKPGALKNLTALKSLTPEIKKIYHNFYTNNYNTKIKEFIDLLVIIKNNDLEKVKEIIKTLCFNKKDMATTDNIKKLIKRSKNDEYKIDKTDKIIKNSNTILSSLDESYGFVDDILNVSTIII